MATKIYNKLIRDRIIEVIESKGQKATYRSLNESESIYELNKKLLEECKEFIEADDIGDVKEEMADVLEVLYAIAKSRNIDLAEIENIRIEKAKEKGAFNKKLFLISVEE